MDGGASSPRYQDANYADILNDVVRLLKEQ